MPRRRTNTDWTGWLDRWDRQQESFNPDRERRFEAILDILEASLPARFLAIDLGCGPGSLAVRLLRRFPRARVVAVDFDPVVLRLGWEALGTLGGRLAWVDAKLAAPGWTDRLPVRRFDAAVSTSALHWLTPRELGRLYSDLARLLRRGGVFLNGDILPWGADRKALRRMSEEVRSLHFHGKSLNAEWGPWKRWWREIAKVPALRAEFIEQKARFSAHPDREPPSLDVHARALRRAGFREVDVVWQEMENRVLMAIR